MHHANQFSVGTALTALLTLLSTTAAGAATWHVDDDTCPAAGDGSAATPFCSIQAGIDAAADADEILVEPGTYHEAIDLLGKAVAVRSVGGAASTTIDATGLSTSVVRCVTGEPPGTLLEGLTLTGGDAAYGGGVRISASSLTIRATVIEGNQATYFGGGLHILDGADVLVEASTIRGNTAATKGGAFYGAQIGTLITLRDVTIAENSSLMAVTALSGGALIMERCALQNNTGDGLRLEDAPATITDTLFEATSGLALFANDDLTVSRCVFRRNGNGAISAQGQSETLVDNSVFVANTAETSVLALTASLTTLVNCAVVANTFRTEDNWQVWAVISGTDATNVHNSIVWGNVPHDFIRQTDLRNIDVRSSIVDARVSGTGNFEADPRFVRMPDPGLNGWDGIDDDYGDLHLTSESPCVDAADGSLVPPSVLTDLDGQPRASDASCAPGSAVDIGPYEFTSAPGCGDGVCGPSETCATCDCDCGSCCGNGVCDDNEDCSNCKVDCACPALQVPAFYATIQGAIDEAGPGDEILVSPGTYHESIDFRGKRITVRGTGGPEVTTIDCSGLGTCVRFIGAENFDSVLSGLTLTGGTGVAHSTDPSKTRGGAIFSLDSMPRIVDCIIRDSTATDGGGMWGAATSLADTAFIGNTATERGGALNGGASLFLRCTFSSNNAEFDGGAIAGSGDVFSNCTFEDNSSNGDGGAVWTQATATLVSDCTFTRNFSAQRGGAWHDRNISTTTLNNCHFTQNTALSFGGGYYNLGYSSVTTITGGVFEGNVASSGGGLEVRGTTIVSDSLFQNNAATEGNGGGLSTRFSSSVSNSRFVGNVAADTGGGVFQANIDHCTFEGNSARRAGGCRGGSVTASRFVGNTATEDGGGLVLGGSGATNCEFEGNSARTAGGCQGGPVTASRFVRNTATEDGGGLVLGGSSATNCEFEGNAATTGGGLTVSAGGSVTACRLFGNRALSGGGVAILNAHGATLINSELIGNSAAIGGGVFAQDGTDPSGTHSSLINSTLVANSADSGSGIAVSDEDSAGQPSPITVTVSNSILRNGAGSDVWVGNASEALITYSDLTGGYPGTGNQDLDPLFVRDPDDGGDGFGDDPNTTGVDESLNDDFGDLGLTAGSPCIDAGSNSAVPTGVTADLDGGNRFVDHVFIPDTGEGLAPIVDMGALERPAPEVLGVTVLANRYFAVASQAGSGETAIGVTLVDLTGFPGENGRTLWVGPPRLEPEEDSTDPGRTFVAARLQCQPHFELWSSFELVYVHGGEILPSSEYVFVEHVAKSPGVPGAAVGVPITVRTGQWGDVTLPFSEPGGPLQPDFKDISAVVAKFIASPAAPAKTYAQLHPNVPIPSRAVDFGDIAADVSAFVGTAYVDIGGISGPCTCPSAVTCAAMACGNDLECGTGFCIDGFCTDACGRCTP